MNRRIVFYVLGRIMIVTAALMVPSVIVALLYREGWAGVYPFLVTICGMVIVGGALSYRRPDDMTYYMKEGFAIVALTWIVLSLTGALPYASFLALVLAHDWWYGNSRLRACRDAAHGIERSLRDARRDAGADVREAA